MFFRKQSATLAQCYSLICPSTIDAQRLCNTMPKSDRNQRKLSRMGDQQTTGCDLLDASLINYSLI